MPPSNSEVPVPKQRLSTSRIPPHTTSELAERPHGIRLVRSMPALEGPWFTSVAWSPDGRHLSFQADTSTITLRATDSWRHTRKIDTLGLRINVLSFDPTHTSLVGG